MAKRGRKPKENKQTGYFYKREEEAVLAYLSATTAEEKNEIYNTVLRPAFEKMAESIIRRYKLFVPNETFVIYQTYHPGHCFRYCKKFFISMST